ncbi:hypothetical protein HDZ31DRAFT_67217 [Schizophyllum fasciatum]
MLTLDEFAQQRLGDETLVAELRRLLPKIEKEEALLPTRLELWREVYMMRPREVNSSYLIWRYLSDFFKARGYDLYVPCRDPVSDTLVDGAAYPADYMAAIGHAQDAFPVDAFGILGSRRYVCSFFPYAAVWAAKNSSGNEFVVKAVSDGQNAKGLNELRILEFLAREDVRGDSRNHTVPVVEFIRYEQYVFAIFPRWSGFPESDIKTPRTAIECCSQITEGIAFLHEKRIGHLDISIENFVINFFGISLPPLAPVVEHLPIRYGIIDFGESVFFDAASEQLAPDAPKLLAPPRDYCPRPTSAPEVGSQQPFDPFAADVYQTGMFILEQFYVRTR